MQFEQMLTTLGLEEHAETLRPGWEESQQSLPSGEIEFLTPAFLRAAGEEIPSSPEGVEAAIAVAARVAGDEALRAYAWHYHTLLFGGGPPDWHRSRHWPVPERVLGDDTGLLCTLVLLSGLPRMHAEHRAHHVPPEVVQATLANVRCGLTLPREGRRRGTNPHDVGWFGGFLRAELFRLGRLQFQFGQHWLSFRAFRHRDSEVVLALAGPGARYDCAGQVARSEGEGWTATLEIGEQGAVGYPILPTGVAVQQQVTLPAAEWEQVLGPGDGLLNIHIPGGGGEPMAYEACGDSFRQALDFFPRHYPDYAFRGFQCESWVLNSWFETSLPPSSNMVRFQREVYLLPVELDPDEPAHVAFGYHGVPTDLSQASRKTSLQRALLQVLEAGEKVPLAAGGCFLLREDVRWGEEVYRSQELPFGL